MQPTFGNAIAIICVCTRDKVHSLLQPIQCGFGRKAPDICFRTGSKVRDDVICQLMPRILTNAVLRKSAALFNVPPIIDPIRPPIVTLTAVKLNTSNNPI